MSRKTDYADRFLRLMETEMGLTGLREKIEYKRIYTVEISRRITTRFSGSALGFAHNLMQTAIFRPKIFRKRWKGCYYVGAGTNPGIGTQIV